MASRVEEPYKSLLRMLADCRELHDVGAVRQQREGATYKRLAHVVHLVGMNAAQRGRWYEVAVSVPLSQRHCGHLIHKFRREAA